MIIIIIIEKNMRLKRRLKRERKSRDEMRQKAEKMGQILAGFDVVFA